MDWELARVCRHLLAVLPTFFLVYKANFGWQIIVCAPPSVYAAPLFAIAMFSTLSALTLCLALSLVSASTLDRRARASVYTQCTVAKTVALTFVSVLCRIPSLL